MSAVEESVLRIAIDHLLEGVQIIGFDWTYRYLNEAAASHAQQSSAELVGQSMLEVYPGIEKTELFAVLRRVMQTRRPERLLNEFAYPNGQRRWFRLLVDPVPAGLCILSLDVTESYLSDRRLLQAQKLEAIGQLAGGIAHDFNNVLTAILGYAELITEQIGHDKPIGRDLEEIVAAAERASTLTRQLLTFTRGQDPERKAVSLHDVMARLEAMLRRLIPENIAIRFAYQAERDAIWASETQIEQIILNLVVNARDAMPSGGMIAVTTTTVNATAAQPLGLARLGEHIKLTVTDSGVGMTPDVAARIFEPLFTTKAPGQGTGLGLVAVKDVISRLNGDIRVESAPGRGTTFEVFLPTTDMPVKKPTIESREAPPVGRETILLVEDDPGVRSFAATVLRRYGYRVVEAMSGEAALAEVARSEEIDLVLADLVLPGIDGSALAKQLDQYRPGIRAILMTGYTHPAVQLPPHVELLSKPFAGHTLLARVRQALS